VNLIDHKKLCHLYIESVGEDLPVTADILLAVSLLRAEIEADKIALTNATMPGAKSMCQKIASRERRSFQIFYMAFF
jgi:hypothetical protein